LIAFFIYIGAGQERSAVEVRAVLRGLTVDQAFSRDVHILRLTDTLQDAVDVTLSSFQATFPVCNEVKQLQGILPYTRLVEGLRAQEHETPVARVMLTDIPAVEPERDLIEAQQLMRERHLEALPVVKDGRFLGLITLNDVGEVLRLLSVDPDLLPRKSRQAVQTTADTAGEVTIAELKAHAADDGS
ncbi:MAG: CBS domain-containing protein, partial [Anaerolineales bacterium]|nr:CBS domain-containing protein [Anaerolineales bacterium]